MRIDLATAIIVHHTFEHDCALVEVSRDTSYVLVDKEAGEVLHGFSGTLDSVVHFLNNYIWEDLPKP